MIFESAYMIRGGLFGEDFTIQFLLSVAAFVVCLADWRMHRRKDYFWVFITGSVVWTLAELVLQLTQTRELGTTYLFGIPIPFALSVILQGMAEGAAIAILGICIGDLLLAKSSRKAGMIAFAIILAGITIVSSRNTPRPSTWAGTSRPAATCLPLAPSYLWLPSVQLASSGSGGPIPNRENEACGCWRSW
jgi:hypothetical protein